MTAALTARQVRTRYTALLLLRWFPVGLWIPVTVLLPLSRGFSLAEVGLASAMQGFVVLALELPTGGMADAWGRRPVLLLASGFAVAAMALILIAHTFAVLAIAYALMGIFRALDSGPLDSWFVDQTLAVNPGARLEQGLGAGSAALSTGIAAGALTSGGLTAWVRLPGIEPLALPVLLALLVTVGGLVAVVLVVREPQRPRRGAGVSVRAVPRAIADGLRLVRRSRVLAALIAVEVCWGFGMVTFESLMPVRLADLVGGEQPAAAMMGPAATAGWLVCAAGAALIPLLSARIGVAPAAIALRVLQGGAVILMGVLAGPVGLFTGYLAAYLVHGAANPLHMTLLHREVSSANRATVVSMNSMAAQPAGSLGMIALTALATGASVELAIVVGGVVLALAAPLYVPALRAERKARQSSSRDDDEPVVAAP